MIPTGPTNVTIIHSQAPLSGCNDVDYPCPGEGGPTTDCLPHGVARHCHASADGKLLGCNSFTASLHSINVHIQGLAEKRAMRNGYTTIASGLTCQLFPVGFFTSKYCFVPAVTIRAFDYINAFNVPLGSFQIFRFSLHLIAELPSFSARSQVLACLLVGDHIIIPSLAMARKYLGGSGERLTVWISIAASTVLIFYGYDQGVFGNVLVSEDFLRTMGYPSTAAQGTMTSVYNLGCFGGALSTLYTGDKLGRPRVLMLGSAIIAVAAIIQASSFSAAQMYVGRVVAGLGTGMNTATAGVWQSETSKMRSRGKLIIIQMANCITGFAISNWLTLGFSFAPGSVSWRFPLAFQMCRFHCHETP